MNFIWKFLYEIPGGICFKILHSCEIYTLFYQAFKIHLCKLH